MTSGTNEAHVAAVPQVDASLIRRAVGAAGAGTIVEYFDYALYGYLATTIATVFFPPGNDTAALLGTFAVFGVSLFVRPVGGMFWGNLGDKVGRQRVLAMTVIIMSLATVSMGLIPGYDSIGLLAPILLFIARLVQGFSASGEYAGATAFIAEYAPDRRRGLLCSIVPATTAGGLLLGATVATLLQYNLSEEALTSWGWRIPFLLAGPLGLAGLYIRTKLEDTPRFRALERASEVAQSPLLTGIRENLRAIVLTFLIGGVNAVGFYMLLAYMPTYLSEEIGFGNFEAIFITTAALFVYIAIVPLIGALSDRLGRKPLLIGASVLFLVLTYPAFALLSQGGLAAAFVAQILLGAVLSLNDATFPSFFAEMFPTKVRYSGFALSFNVGIALFGGTAPFVATLLIAKTGSTFAPGFYLMAFAVVALVAVLLTKETAGKRLRDV